MSQTIAGARALLESRGFTVTAPCLTIYAKLGEGRLVVARNNETGTWRGYDFRNFDMRGADFRGLDLTTARFGSANLDGADFRGATIAHCHFRYCKLNGTDFRNCIGLDSATFNYSPRHLAKFTPEKPDRRRTPRGKKK